MVCVVAVAEAACQIASDAVDIAGTNAFVALAAHFAFAVAAVVAG